jgi:UMP-CMP kinase
MTCGNRLNTGHLETHNELVQPVIKYLEKQGKVIKVWVRVYQRRYSDHRFQIDSNQSIEQCHREAGEAVLKVLA